MVLLVLLRHQLTAVQVVNQCLPWGSIVETLGQCRIYSKKRRYLKKRLLPSLWTGKTLVTTSPTKAALRYPNA